MAPDGMPTMTAPIEALPSTEPGVYRFKTNLTMEGGWQLSLGAKIQGETGTLREQAGPEGRAMKRIVLTGLALAAVVAAGVGGYWAGVRGLPAPGVRAWFGVEPTLAAAEPAGSGSGDLLSGSRRQAGLFGDAAPDRGRPGFPCRSRQRGCQLRGQAAGQRLRRPARQARGASSTTATRWACPTPRRCRRRIRWGWTTSPSTKERMTAARS